MNKLSLFVLVQIFLLLVMPASTSYQIGQTDDYSGHTNTEDLGRKVFDKGLGLLVGFFSIKQIGGVSAAGPDLRCCLETEQGELCREFLPGAENNCKADLIPGSCNLISSCELGCCIDNDEGLCTTKTTRQACEADGGDWNNEENCAINECQKGCCVLGSEAQFIGNSRCTKISSLFGFDKDFRQQINNELECLSLAASAVKSACVFGGERCEFKSEVECVSERGDYYSGLLCSNANLSVSCDKQASIGCIDGKDEIYWFDSCGNQENIYDSDKDRSWHAGRVLQKDLSCGAGEGNIDSQNCGNCNRFLGSVCSETGVIGGVQDGNYICQDLSCVDENGNERDNGESWCVYDGVIGDGKDVVGSRHWKRMCIEGKIKIEPCADYRGGVCVQSDVEGDKGDFSIAACTINEASACISYNQKKDTLVKNCETNNMCYLKKINVDKGFKFDICLPNYPKGFDLSYDANHELAQNLCKLANQKCTVIYEKKIRRGWKCIFNCNCEDSGFGRQMNDLCTSLGDCGSYVNYIGDGTDNSVVRGSAGVSWEDYVEFATPIDGQFAEPKSLSDFLIQHGSLTNPGAYEGNLNEIGQTIGFVGTVSGGIGIIVQAGYAVGWIVVDFGAYGLVENAMLSWGLAGDSVAATTYGPMLSALGAFAVGITVSSILTYAFGLEGQAAQIMTFAGAAAGVAMGVATFGGDVTLKACLMGGACLVIIAILVIIAVVLKILGIGDTKERVVSFQCDPWEAPVGADNCGVCDGDPLLPCSKYRCESLGQACILLNEDTDNPTCEKIINDLRPPVISPGEIEEGYNFVNEETWSVSVRRDQTECIPEFKIVLFGLDTNEPAQCKFEFERNVDYSEMQNFPIELNAFTSEHTFGFMMPSLDSLSVYDLTGNIREMFGNLNMYVKCQDYYGDITPIEYAVNFCIESGPDLTAAYITASEPQDLSSIKYGESMSPLKIYLNEPAECKYDSEDGEYSLMSKTMECNTGIEESEYFGWSCLTELTGLLDESNTIYIKCKDQPWFKDSVNESQRNINSEGFAYTLYKTQNPLEIDYVTPEGEINSGFIPVSVDFEVKTSEGAENGVAACSYSFTGYDNMILFSESYSNIHRHNFNRLTNGPYVLYVECVDDAGNIAKGFTEIEINLDETPPVITRLYREGNQLVITTDEEAECFYRLDKCIYDVGNATSMTTGFSKEHRAEWESGLTYHIKCVDVWGNVPSECSRKLLPSFF